MCCSPWGRNELDTTVQPNGEGNGTPLQYSCLENLMDGGAQKAAVHGVAKSRTQLSDFPFTFTFMHWRRKWQHTPVFLPGKSHGQRSLVGYSPWGRKESDTTERLHFTIDMCTRNIIFNIKALILSATHWCLPRAIAGEGNGTPLQYSCLENPMGGGAW